MAPINSLYGLRRRYENDPARAAAETAANADIDRHIANGEARAARMAGMGRNPGLEMAARRAAAGTYGHATKGITLSGPGNGSSNSLREAAAYAGASPGLRRGSDVFGRNDREAALQRNRDFIASGRSSMFGPRPATTKGRLAMMAAGAGESGLMGAGSPAGGGLRTGSDVAMERVRQEGETRRALIGAKKDAYIARGTSIAARREAQEARAAAAAEAAAGRAHEITLTGLRTAADEKAAADKYAQEVKLAEMGYGEAGRIRANENEQRGLDRGHEITMQGLRDAEAARIRDWQTGERIGGQEFQSGQTQAGYDHEKEMTGLNHEEAARMRNWQGEQNALDRAEQRYNNDENRRMVTDAQEQARAQREFDANNRGNAELVGGSWVVKQKDGTFKSLSPEEGERLTAYYSTDIQGAAFNPRTGRWESHGVPIDRSVVQQLEARYADAFNQIRNLQNPELWTIAIDPNGRPRPTWKGAQLPNGWQEVPEADKGYIEWLTLPH